MSQTEGTRFFNRKWVGPVLLVSFALNLFLGVLAAVEIGHRFYERDRPEFGGPFGMPHGVVRNDLSREERRAVLRAMRPHMGTLAPHVLSIREARLALSQAVAADPYDPEVAKQAFADLRRAIDGLTGQTQGALVEAFAELSPETRDRIAEGLERHRPRGERRWRPHHPERDRDDHDNEHENDQD